MLINQLSFTVNKPETGLGVLLYYHINTKPYVVVMLMKIAFSVLCSDTNTGKRHYFRSIFQIFKDERAS